MKIKPSEISIVFQGTINPTFIAKGVDSARNIFPGAEIIISTWKGECVPRTVEKLCDAVLYNDDPGGIVFCRDGSIQNHNRQIVSSIAGISRTTRKYVMKLRSDMLILGDEFLRFYSKYKKRHKDFVVFKDRIIINSYCTNDSRGRCPCLFHPSDWVSFGLREDLLNLWGIPLAEEPQMSQYFRLNPEKYSPNKNILTRWHSEQYIWLSCLRNNGYNIEFDTWFSFDKKLAWQSDVSLVNNFIVLDYKKSMSVLSQKYESVNNGAGILNHNGWLYLYHKYVDNSIKVPFATKVVYHLGLKPVKDRIEKIIYKYFG